MMMIDLPLGFDGRLLALAPTGAVIVVGTNRLGCSAVAAKQFGSSSGADKRKSAPAAAAAASAAAGESQGCGGEGEGGGGATKEELLIYSVTGQLLSRATIPRCDGYATALLATPYHAPFLHEGRAVKRFATPVGTWSLFFCFDFLG
jgi:hypothetical protein